MSVDVAQLVYLAAEIEFAIFALAFLACVVILSLKTAWFLVGTVLDHAFPNWKRALWAAWRRMRRSRRNSPLEA